MHPILVRIPLPGWKLFGALHAIPIHSYGIMLGLSLVVGWYVTLGLAEKDGLPKETLGNCYVVTAISAVLMSRVLYFVTNPGEFSSVWEAFALWRGGLVAYGGFLGGFLGSLLYMRRLRLPLWPWADVAAPALAAGLMLTRMGCYLFGCDFGKPLSPDTPAWLQRMGTFPHWAEGTVPNGSGSPAWFQHVQHHLIDADSVASLPVHPTQIYESLVGAALLVLTLAVRKQIKFRGQVFLIFTFAYGLLRFLLEVLRDDLERGEFGPHMSEHLAMSGALAAFALAYAALIAPSIVNLTVRRISQAAACVLPLVAYFWLRPASFGAPTIMQLSTSQWVAILTALPAAIAYAIFQRGAAAHPDSALSIELEPFYQLHPEARVTTQSVRAPLAKEVDA
jgi:phosphatidylglycerol:prolipoprotein diacylglycerol transferase